MIDRGFSVLRLQDLMELESAQSIYKWLAGDTIPTVDKLVKLSQIFDCSIDDIIVTKETAVEEWFYVYELRLFSPLGRSRAEKYYILETVIDHLPKVLGPNSMDIKAFSTQDTMEPSAMSLTIVAEIWSKCTASTGLLLMEISDAHSMDIFIKNCRDGWYVYQKSCGWECDDHITDNQNTFILTDDDQKYKAIFEELPGPMNKAKIGASTWYRIRKTGFM